MPILRLAKRFDLVLELKEKSVAAKYLNAVDGIKIQRIIRAENRNYASFPKWLIRYIIAKHARELFGCTL